MLTDEEFKSIIDYGYEQRSIEYKCSQFWDNLKQKIAKTAMGMANLRDGGIIIIGVTKKNDHYEPDGMLNEHIDTFNSDNVQSYINSFADPPIPLEIYKKEWNDKQFIIIRIHCFYDYPIICKKDSINDLRKGAVYIRSKRTPETCEVQSLNDMREIIDIATEKGIIRYMEMQKRIESPKIIKEKTNSEKFNNQLGEL
jgi:predicted HTH transcriptional regulator